MTFPVKTRVTVPPKSSDLQIPPEAPPSSPQARTVSPLRSAASAMIRKKVQGFLSSVTAVQVAPPSIVR
ncbi:MAG: hypothetical protein MZU91_10670 [Desulfosudis oleivorans]|nr:hypothetical protein [Desulfosudis oleivorans]